jgi:hypothetical protein
MNIQREDQEHIVNYHQDMAQLLKTNFDYSEARMITVESSSGEEQTKWVENGGRDVTKCDRMPD